VRSRRDGLRPGTIAGRALRIDNLRRQLADGTYKGDPRRGRAELRNLEERQAARIATKQATKSAKLRRKVEEKLAAGPPPRKPRAALPKKNRARKKALREKQFSVSDGYRDYIIRQACTLCGAYHTEVGTEPAHVKTRGSGADATYLLPLCGKCHRWQEEHRVQFKQAFTRRHGLPPAVMAKALREAYLLGRQAE
jgi:hypothetical protein